MCRRPANFWFSFLASETLSKSWMLLC